MHHHSADSHLTASALHSERNLAAVGDQDLFEHGRIEVRRRCGRGTFLSMLLFNDEQRLAVLHRLPVLDQDLLNRATDLGFNFVQQLHRFDDA
jgi:hypothetical protein